MSLKPLGITLVLMSLAMNTFAEDKSGIRGQVVDSVSGEPVEFACVSNTTHTIGFVADAQGCFFIDSSQISTDSIFISRIGYQTKTLAFDEIPPVITLFESPTTLRSVTVVPKKKKTMGSMFIPNAAQKAIFDLVSKVDVFHEHNHYVDTEVGRKFKFKKDTRINKLRVCLNKNDNIRLIFNVYRKVDEQWVNIHDKPISVDVAVSRDWRNIVEVDVTEFLDPQPKGEYLIGVLRQGGGNMNLWAKQPVFEDGRQRIIGTDKWKKIDPVPGIEIEVEY